MSYLIDRQIMDDMGGYVEEVVANQVDPDRIIFPEVQGVSDDDREQSLVAEILLRVRDTVLQAVK